MDATEIFKTIVASNFFAEDAGNAVTEMGTQLVDTIVSSIVFFTLGLVLVGVVLGVMYYFFIYKKKFDIEVKINSERAGERYTIIFDNAAIMTDPHTKSKYIRIWGLKVDLPLPKFEVIQKTSRGDYIEIYREADNKFFYCTPPKFRKDMVLDNEGNYQEVAGQDVDEIKTDMDYWNIKRKQQNKKMFDTESLMMKIIPFIPVIVGSVMMIFILFVLLDKIPEVLNQLDILTKSITELKMAGVGSVTPPVYAGP